MCRYALFALMALALAACSPYVRNETSAAAGGSAGGSYLVKVIPDSGGPTETRPTSYPSFRPGEKVRILADGSVVPM